ncbi:MAG TPA: hypothetical protein VL381_01405 [Rhodocyclaceae bacterium]|nr:hypothetical protein [Rhodocyclaceae bacterium]
MKNNKSIDVFNGDADGLCALMQWRQVYPQSAQLVSGVKRDNSLLKNIEAGPGDELLVLDINFENNRADVVRLLAAGASIRYFDHHYPGVRIEHPALSLTIDESPQCCTSLLLNQALAGKQWAWAITGAFGDNLPEVAQALAANHGLSTEQGGSLRKLGELLNYNGYGNELADLHFNPVDLYQALREYAEPFAFIAAADQFKQLCAGHAEDMSAASGLTPQTQNPGAAVYVLPDQAWARRVIGVWANDLSQQYRQRAHLILCPDGGGSYTASVRAAQQHPYGASAFCREFPGGGGREAAGGITRLAENQLESVIKRFLTEFPVN